MKPWLRPLPYAAFAAAVVAHLTRAPVDDAAPTRSAALCKALAGDVACEPGDVVWLEGARGVVGALGLGTARALVRGRERGGATDDLAGGPTSNDTLDLWSVRARLSPEGQLIDVASVHNLTRSPSADEGLPIVRGTLAAYVVELDGHPEAVHVLDLAGHRPDDKDELTRAQRAQVAIAAFQATGQVEGVRRTVFALSPPPERARLAFRGDGLLEVRLLGGAAEDAEGGRTVVVDAARGDVIEGAASVRVTAETVAKPPTFAPWMSDRLRALSWFGDERNQALKAVVFTVLEWVKGVRSELTGDTGEADAQEDLGGGGLAHAEPVKYTDPEVGWPPLPLEPIFKPALAGEGQWIALDKDPFITPIPGVTTPFVTTFVRSDAAAKHTRVYVTLWDPRLVALHMEAGTIEPVSATGEAGPGLVPRAPEVVSHLVGGFNGGFQATHGEFGMQASGVLYLPPKPYGATVLELRDGTTAFGTWPRALAVPDDVLSFRQNMTALVENGKYNPWGRVWWGGVPPGWHDAVHTTRSGLCMTKEGFVGYFWGNEIGPEPLGRAMIAARCSYGIHLDMNPGLAGFEFYNVQPAATFQPLGRPLQADWEAESVVKDMPQLKFRARRMVKSMGHILFPRYIQREARDFFYLTTRDVLPGHPIAKPPGADAGPSTVSGSDGAWRTKGLPQHGYPYAVALTTARPGAGDRRVRVMRLDPRTLRPEPAGSTDTSGLVATFSRPLRAQALRGKGDASAPAPAEGALRLFLVGHMFALDRSPPSGATVIADVLPRGTAPPDARSAVGVSDDDGMLQWVELAPEDPGGADATAEMLALLERLGCSQRGVVAGGVHAFLGGVTDTGGQPAVPGPAQVRLLRDQAPSARLMFEGVDLVPQSVWHPLQARRVKWRPTLAPKEKPATAGSAGPAASEAPPTPAPMPAP